MTAPQPAEVWMVRDQSQPTAIIKVDAKLSPEEVEELAARWKAAWEKNKGRPQVLWFSYGEPVALYPTRAQAEQFAATLERQGRKLTIERWEIPGHE